MTTGKNIAYVRCSSLEQNEARQIEALKNYSIEKYFSEKASAKDLNRPELQAMLDYTREGDVIYIKDFSRIARSTKDLLDIVEKLQTKGVKLISLKENLDSTTSTGKLMLYYQIANTKQPVKTCIDIMKQLCNYGNYRYYFACPDCGEKVYNLYKPYSEVRFACRKCHNLTYRQQKKHNKSDDMYRYAHFDRVANKLILEGKTRTITQRRKIRNLRGKSSKLFQKYFPAMQKQILRLGGRLIE